MWLPAFYPSCSSEKPCCFPLHSVSKFVIALGLVGTCHFCSDAVTTLVALGKLCLDATVSHSRLALRRIDATGFTDISVVYLWE